MQALRLSMLRGRAQTRSVFETRMGIAGPENDHEAKTRVALAASKQLCEGRRERGQYSCQPSVLLAQSLLLCPHLTRGCVPNREGQRQRTGSGGM